MNEREKALIERILAGDTAAFEPLVTPYRTAIMALALRIVRNPEDAQEVAQETLLRAYRYLRSCDLEFGFRNWLYQIAVNTARSFQKRRGDRESGMNELGRALVESSPAEHPEARLERTEFRTRLLDCLNGLSAREREVFLLREIEERNVAETARILDCSSISVRVHLNAARRKVRDRYLERYPRPGGYRC